MAFKDSSGQITIDEVAADRDKRVIASAIDSLQEAKDAMTEIKYSVDSFKGKAANDIGEMALEFIQKYSALMEKLEDLNDTITATVEKYRRIDSNIQKIING